MIHKPARCSFDSRKGPSVRIASSPRFVDDGGRVGRRQATGEDPVTLGLEPVVERADGSCSDGVARPAESSITETRYCISDHLPWFRGAAFRAAAHPYYEHLCPDPTPTLGHLSMTFWYAGCGRSEGETVSRRLRRMCERLDAGMCATRSRAVSLSRSGVLPKPSRNRGRPRRRRRIARDTRSSGHGGALSPCRASGYRRRYERA
jgi:hypothetical protein